MSYDITEELNEWKTSLLDEWKQKRRFLLRAGAPIRDGMEYTQAAVLAKYQPLVRDFNKAYRRNDFYMKDITEKGQEVYNTVR